jgi:hypothetical protein
MEPGQRFGELAALPILAAGGLAWASITVKRTPLPQN